MAAGKVDGAPSMRPGGAEEEEKKGLPFTKVPAKE